jgi:hypothetical protein
MTEEILHKTIKPREISMEVNVITGKYKRKEVSVTVSTPISENEDCKLVLEKHASDIISIINKTLSELNIPKEELPKKKGGRKK